MPYVIAVLTLVVVGVGFALFQSSDETTEQPVADTTTVVDTPPIAFEAPPSEPTTDDSDRREDTWRDDDEDHEEDDEYEDDDDTPAATTVPTLASTAPAPVATTPAPVNTTPTAPAASATDYKNGTYVARTTYRTPERDTYTMDVSITVLNDTISATDITFDSRALRDSYVKRFDSSYTSYVVGKNLGTLSLSRVAGASLTTDAFNNAIVDIRSQAGA